MKNNQNTQNELMQLFDYKSPDVIVNFLVDLIQTFEIDFTILFDKAREELVRREYTIEKKKGQVFLKTGVNRYHLRNILNSEPTKERCITKAQFVLYLRQELNTFCKKKGRNWVYASEFSRLVKSLSGGEISKSACVDILKRQGLIEQNENGAYVLSEFKPQKYEENLELLEYAVPLFNQILRTMLLNNSGTMEENLFQRRYFSTQIPPERAIVVDHLVRDMLSDFLPKLKLIIDSNENDDAKPGDYEPIGVHLTQFNLNRKKV